MDRDRKRGGGREGKQEIEIQTEIEKHEKRMREVGAKPDNELLRDKLQIKEEDRRTEN